MTDAADDWTRIDSEVLGDYDKFRVLRRRSRLAQNGRIFEFHVLDMPDWVNVVPVTTDGRVILAEQYRHGTEAVSLEFPSGVIEEGEDPGTAAVRELEEETGYRAASTRLIGTVDANTALQTNRMRVVLAEGCTPDGEKSQDASEDVRTRVVALEDVPSMIAAGEITHALALTAWYCYDRCRQGSR